MTNPNNILVNFQPKEIEALFDSLECLFINGMRGGSDEAMHAVSARHKMDQAVAAWNQARKLEAAVAKAHDGDQAETKGQESKPATRQG